MLLVTQQASMLAYNNDFKLMMVLTFCARFRWWLCCARGEAGEEC